MEKLTKKEAERVIASASDLIDDPKYRPYFFKKLYALGVTTFVELAEEARREGVEHKGRKFASLLRYGRSRFHG